MRAPRAPRRHSPKGPPSDIGTVAQRQGDSGSMPAKRGCATGLSPLLGSTERVDNILCGRRQLTLAMVQRLRARFGVPAYLLLPPASVSAARRTAKSWRRRHHSAASAQRADIIIDAPVKPEEALPQAQRHAANGWFDHTLYSRPNHKQKEAY